MFRQFFTASTRLFRSYDAMFPDDIDDSETKRIEDDGTSGANIGRPMIGCTVGIEAFGSPSV